MITDALLSVLFAAGRLVVSVIPNWSPPGFVADIGGKAGELGALASGFSTWVPWSIATTVVSAVLATLATVNVVRLSLWLWSKLPVVGS